jgi:hypothetical protein
MTRTPHVVTPHEPLPFETLIALPYPAAVARAAALAGVLMADMLLSIRLDAAPATLTATRTIVELLLTELDRIESTCSACAGTTTDRALACAREIGTLEARLTAVAAQARLALSWQRDRPVAV